ncbi:citrate synthase [Ramlibacter sp.]|uniref:citrate synthase n=1 Tax=Ramlibacter sp. TaxID=1917967 RepID=UPI0017F9A461|nr:citrate synthase [Ramlibacter sp.]MBA2673696.1 citrate synthase [Ramlibacter sp.]
MNRWISAGQALEALGVKPQTLYANVSRGRIRAKADPRDARRSLYNGEDVGRLRAQRAGRRPAEVVAVQAIHWGEPVLPSAITAVMHGRLWYRGVDAIRLSDSASFEAVCALLWETAEADAMKASAAPVRVDASASPLQAALTLLAARAACDAPSLGRSPSELVADAGTLVDGIASALLGEPARRRKACAMHTRIAAAWKAPHAADAIRKSLVLLADHELNPSTFAARVAVSTGAPLSAALLAGLATLAGPLHAGAWSELRALMEFARGVGPAAAVHTALAQRQRLPAFGHPLYAHGDPRARALLASFDVGPTHADLAREVESATGELPNIDFALGAMADASDLPPHAPLVIFAIARSAGWVAHALEQVRSGEPIRPRARYTGAMPVA